MKRSEKKNIIYKEQGSVTLEASITLPIFIFLLLFMYGFIMMFTGQQLIAHALLQSSQSLSLDSYATETIGAEDYEKAKGLVRGLYNSVLTTHSENFSSSKAWYKDDSAEEVIKKRFIGFFADGDEEWADNMLKTVGVKEGMDGINFKECKVGDDNDLHIKIKYTQRFLFDLNGAASFDREIEVVAHMWGMK